MGMHENVAREEKSFMSMILVPGLIGLAVALVVFMGFNMYVNQTKVKDSVAAVKMWADKLDGMTYDTGVYKKIDGPDTNEGDLEVVDGWNQNLRYQYSMGGAMEVVKVMSSGKDGKFYTSDDIVMEKHSVNLKGVGTGIKKNVGEFTHNASKGVITGAAEGAKEAGVIVFAKAKESAGNKVTDVKEGVGSKIAGAKDKLTGFFNRNKEEVPQQ